MLMPTLTPQPWLQVYIVTNEQFQVIQELRELNELCAANSNTSTSAKRSCIENLDRLLAIAENKSIIDDVVTDSYELRDELKKKVVSYVF